MALYRCASSGESFKAIVIQPATTARVIGFASGDNAPVKFATEGNTATIDDVVTFGNDTGAETVTITPAYNGTAEVVFVDGSTSTLTLVAGTAQTVSYASKVPMKITLK